MNQTTINEATIRGKWNQLKGKVKEQFGQLTDDDLMKTSGSVDRLIGTLQERYGYTRGQAQSEWDKFINKQNDFLLSDDAQSDSQPASANTWSTEGTESAGNTESTDKSVGKYASSPGANGNVVEYVQGVAATALEQGKQVVGETIDQGLQRVNTVVSEQQQQAARTLQGVADALHSSSDELRKGDQETFADYATAAADYVADFSNFLSNRNPLEIWGEVQTFARRQPEVFVLGTLTAGFLLGRFLRSSGSGQQNNAYPKQTTTSQQQGVKAGYSPRQRSNEGQPGFVQNDMGNSDANSQRYGMEGRSNAQSASRPSTFANAAKLEEQSR